MGIKFLLILLFEAEDYLDGNPSASNFAILADNGLRCISTMNDEVIIDGQRRGILLEYMRCNVLTSDRVLSDSFLVTAHLKRITVSFN